MAETNTVNKFDQIFTELKKVIVGQTEVLQQMMTAFVASGNVLLEGVPGLGKTLMIKALAKTFKGSFSRIQFTPDLMPADVCGHMMYDSHKEEFKLKKGPIFTNLLLADEINRASAKTQSAMLEVMQEHQVTIEGNSLPLPPPFMVLATQNPIEQEGTYPLPEAQLDRFLLKIKTDYPTVEEETEMVDLITDGKVANALDVENVKSIITREGILKMQKAVEKVKVDKRVIKYAVDIVANTRNYPGVTTGAGPRGSIALIRAARAAAVIAGRDYLTPDDIKDIYLPALRHRIILSPSLEIEGLTSDDILEKIVTQVEAPRL